MTTVAFQGQGGGLPAEEWTLASVLLFLPALLGAPPTRANGRATQRGG